MSLKNLELQVALPRTVDNSRIHHISQQQTILQNEMDSQQLKSRTEQAEQTVAETFQNERAGIRERQQRAKNNEQPDRGRLNEDSDDPLVQSAPHPYVGHKLDIKM